MKQALVIGASGGLGGALAAELVGRGYAVSRISRQNDGLDITDEARIVRAFADLTGPFDRVLIATGVLSAAGHRPEKSLSEIDPQTMMQVLAANTLGPALLLKYLVPLLPRSAPCRIGVLSARVGSIGDNSIGGWHSYRASKAALNQIVRGAAIELARTHKQAICVALHPGTVQTAFTADYAARHKTVPAPQAAANLLNVMDALLPGQTGGFFDWQGQPVVW